MKIPASELPLQPGGQIYHLGIHPEDLADHIIVVGDPGRVESISKYFDTVDFKHTNRELVTHTGTLRGQRITVLSTGMGTDNIDIVMTELDALASIDLKKMEIKDAKERLRSTSSVSGLAVPCSPKSRFTILWRRAMASASTAFSIFTSTMD